MRSHHSMPVVLAALALATLGASCPTLPQIEERTVELAVGSSTTFPWQARGVVNVYDETASFDINDRLDLAAILDKAGIDAADVKRVTLSGVHYRVSVPDPNAGRSITGGTVSARRGLGAEVTLIHDFSADASTPGPFAAAQASPAGVTLINGLLEDLLAAAQSGGPVSNGTVTFRVSGISNPTGAETDFDWELRLDISVVGNFKVKVLN